VNQPLIPLITISTPSQVICEKTNTSFTANGGTMGSSNLYQWTKNGINVGTNSPLYEDNQLQNGDELICKATLSGGCLTTNVVSSNSIVMTVTSLITPKITITSSVNDVCFGTPITFTAATINGGQNPEFTWYKNGINLFLNSSTYTDDSLKDGDIITAALRSNLSCSSPDFSTSNKISPKINSLVTPIITINASTMAFCKGSPVNFTATSSNEGSTPVYRWMKNNTFVGNNSKTYTDNDFSNNDVISCVLNSNANCASSSEVTSNNIRLTVHPNPNVTLDQNPNLCSGSSRRLDPGMFSNYFWNNGSQNRSIDVNAPGVYSVKVTDKNGCEGTGTTEIRMLLPVPSGFMPPDTAICSYGALLLKANRDYQKYFWSTGSTWPSISIAQPGQYSLEVTDDNNCKATEFVEVSLKLCMNGLYLPSAFTPDNDGKNDTFRPLLFGDVKEYRLVIYNRWGNLVFLTEDVLHGWNGTYKGLKLSSEVYAWACTYRFNLGLKTTIKGTVLIIK